MVSLKQIMYALAVADTRHFKKAAEQCAISQSALSTGVSELEKTLGFAVFERDNKRVLVTPRGALFLERAAHINQELKDIRAIGSDTGTPLGFPMSVGIIPTIAPYLLPAIYPHLKASYPAFEMHVEEDQSHVIVDKVKKGDLDAGILALPYDCEGLLSLTFWEEDFYWIVPKQHALAHITHVQAQDIEQANLMLLKDGHCFKDHALNVCQYQQVKTQHLGATSLHTLIQMVQAGIGTTLAPHMALPHLIEKNSALKAIKLNEPGPHRLIALVVRPNYPNFKSIECLKALFGHALTSLKD